MYLFSHQTRLKYFLLAMPCDETIFFFFKWENTDADPVLAPFRI